MGEAGFDFGACRWRLPGGVFYVKFGVKGTIGWDFLDHVFYSDVPFQFIDGFVCVYTDVRGLNTKFRPQAEGGG